MSHTVKFLFFLASAVCLALAAIGPGRLARPGRTGTVALPVGLEPLGLFLFVFPFMWEEAVAAF